MHVQLGVAFLGRERCGSCCRSDSTPDFAPEMSPIQDTGGLGKVPPLLGLDPAGSVGHHHHCSVGILAHLTCGSLHELTQLDCWTKGGDRAPLRQPMALPGRFSRSSLAPGKRGIPLRHRQIFSLRTDHCHFAFHISSLLPTAHPSAIHSHQHWRLCLLTRLLAGTSLAPDLLRLLLLGVRSLLALRIGQQTDLFGTDLGSTPLLQQPTCHARGPRTPGQQCRLLQGLADRSPFKVFEQIIGWTSPAPTSLTTKAPTLHLDASEHRRADPAHCPLQSALLAATMRTRPPLLFP